MSFEEPKVEFIKIDEESTDVVASSFVPCDVTSGGTESCLGTRATDECGDGMPHTAG